MVACSACKPGSVEARIDLPIPRQGDPVLGRSFLSERGRPRPQAAYPRLRAPPTAERRWRGGPPLAAYLALLRPGFTEPRLLPGMRWALTPPFHPYRRRLRRVMRRRRSPFCATFRRLSPPGVSPAFCPVVSGLSSPVSYVSGATARQQEEHTCTRRSFKTSASWIGRRQGLPDAATARTGLTHEA